MIIHKIYNKIERSIRYRKYKNDYIEVFKKAIVDKETIFEGHNKVIGITNIASSYFGYGSYIGDGGLVKRTRIGKYSSIGPNFRILDGTHPTEIFVSTYPAFYRGSEFCGLEFSEQNLFQEHIYTDKSRSWLCEIGNDVWIGDSVSIINGVTIGDGAVIAAGAVVTKNIPPYAIVGGVPAKVIRYRFTEDQIQWLLEFQWWNKELEWIKNNSILFSNIDELMNVYRRKMK